MNEVDPRLSVLLVENLSSNTETLRAALERSNHSFRLHAVGYGKDAADYLRRDGPYGTAPTPDLVLLDLSEASKRQFKVMDRVRAETLERDIPLVILTSFQSEESVENAYDGHDGRVVFSPIELDTFLKTMHDRSTTRFLNAVSLIQKFGLVLVRIPSERGELQPDSSIAASA